MSMIQSCMKQWKNILPSIAYGLQKMSVAPELIIAAPQTAEIPIANIVSANEEEASVAPAVVDAVAADINAPDIGAINASLI